MKREHEKKRRSEAREDKKKANKNFQPTTWDELVSQPIESVSMPCYIVLNKIGLTRKNSLEISEMGNFFPSTLLKGPLATASE